jgi:hypothetical protein
MNTSLLASLLFTIAASVGMGYFMLRRAGMGVADALRKALFLGAYVFAYSLFVIFLLSVLQVPNLAKSIALPIVVFLSFIAFLKHTDKNTKAEAQQISAVEEEDIGGSPQTESGDSNEQEEMVLSEDVDEDIESSQEADDFGQLVLFVFYSGIGGGLGLLFLKFAHGIYNNYGVSASIESIFTSNGLILFGIGFAAGAGYPFFSRNQ